MGTVWTLADLELGARHRTLLVALISGLYPGPPAPTDIS